LIFLFFFLTDGDIFATDTCMTEEQKIGDAVTFIPTFDPYRLKGVLVF